MGIAQTLLPEFDNEMANTRTVLERVPEDKLGWKPDPKSMSMGRLAGHVAEMVGWGTMTLQTEGLNIDPAHHEALVAGSRQQLLAAFDKNVVSARAALAAATDQAMMVNWTLSLNGAPLFTMPRVAVIRSMMMNHIIHHRAQLTVYFRLTGVPVPGMYGPSADEGMPASAGA